MSKQTSCPGHEKLYKTSKAPSSIWMLKSLKSLDLSGCSKLGNLGVFKGLIYKSWCSFFSSWTLVPKGVDSIGLSRTLVQPNSCLTELNLENCHLSYLSEEIGNLISLRTLNLAGNNLSTLPDSICNLTCLKDLVVGNNKLSHLPSEIGDLDSLKTLYLQDNKGLRALPESICKLVRLRQLGLSGCNLSHLPSGIGGLTSLFYLNIEENNICTIPDSISNLPCLDWILLNKCAKLRSLPKLPTCIVVEANCCPSLESLPLELDQLGWGKVDYSECSKLAENSYLTSLLKQLPKSKGLSELKGLFDIIVPVGEEELRIWFPYHEGPNISFVVPPSPSVNQEMLSWILRLVIWAPRGVEGTVWFGDVIRNKIRYDDVFLSSEAFPTDVDHVWLFHIQQGHKGLQLEGGDEVEVEILMCGGGVVKNWAIDVIYEADDELHNGNDTLYHVVGPI
ncbi:hypothetical protein C3L33_05274, partial [Rhododendron williamsianum]